MIRRHARPMAEVERVARIRMLVEGILFVVALIAIVALLYAGASPEALA